MYLYCLLIYNDLNIKIIFYGENIKMQILVLLKLNVIIIMVPKYKLHLNSYVG